MLYAFQDLSRRALRPVAAYAGLSARILRRTPLPGAPFAAAGWELVHRLTKSYPRPSFGIDSVEIDGQRVAITEEVSIATPFCRLVRFARHAPALQATLDAQPKVLL